MNTKNCIIVFRSCIEAYEHFCKPLCNELGMPQMAVDILLFLANNPESCTAKDINKCRGFKENILSVNINKLVKEGFLERLSVEEIGGKCVLSAQKRHSQLLNVPGKLMSHFIRSSVRD